MKSIRQTMLESFGNQDVFEKDFDTEERKKLADKGEALPDGSFPIRNESDLKNAIKSIGRTDNRKRAIDWIKKRANELGKEDLLPDNW